MLQIENIISGYGQVEVLHGISLEVKPGEIVSVIGSNGAGKSTLLRTISGLINVRQGRMTFANQDITSLPPSKIVAMGLVHVPEGRQVFNSLTVFENLLMGIYIKRGEFKKEKKRELLEFVLNLFPILRTREKQVAGTLSGGEQQMLAIARALMSEPKLLLFDEPSMGLSPMVIGNIIEVIRRLNQEVGLTILLVEQNPALGLALSNRTYVLNLGKVIASGNSKEMLMQEDLRKVYLGQTKP